MKKALTIIALIMLLIGLIMAVCNSEHYLYYFVVSLILRNEVLHYDSNKSN